MRKDVHQKSFTPEAVGPLKGVRVVDASRLVCGNTLTFMLADFGAEVIKVERPVTGDPLREWKNGGHSLYWKIFGRNKKSTAIDFARPEGRDVLLRLLETADCFVESFRYGTLEKLGLGPDDLLKRNPRLVIVRVSGWGQTGPYRTRPGFGTLIESFAGFAEKSGYPDRPPLLPNMPLADQVAGLTGAFATLAALRHAEATGEGQVVDLSILEPLHALISADAAIYDTCGEKPQRTGSRSVTVAPRNVYQTADGPYIAIAASMQSMAHRLLAAIGRPELNEDPRYRLPEDRVRNADDLDQIIADWVRSRSLADNLKILGDAGVTVGPVNAVDMLIEDEHVAEREVLVRVPDEEAGTVLMPGIFPRLDRSPGALRTPAPGIGDHTEEILTGLGVEPSQLAALRESGAVQ